MPTLLSRIDPHSAAFAANAAAADAFLQTLRERLGAVAGGGGSAMVDRHHARRKIVVRERIDMLVDPLSPFLELCPLAAWGMHDNGVPAAGLVIGVGVVHGTPCMIIANDATVKGGSFFPETVAKHIRAQEIAAENALPCLYLVDCGGAFLPEQDRVFPARTISAPLSSTNAACRPPASRRSRPCSAAAPRAGPISQRWPTRW